MHGFVIIKPYMDLLFDFFSLKKYSIEWGILCFWHLWGILCHPRQDASHKCW